MQLLKTLARPLITLVSDRIARLPESGIKEEIRNVFYQDIVSERIVEYPLVYMHLPPRPGKILDVGCRYSNLVLQLASLGYQAYGIDLEPYPYSHPNLHFVKGDIRHTGFPSGFFDCVTAISTIEHVGLGFYEKNIQQDKQGDVRAISEIYRLLKKPSRLIFTAPFGRPTQTPTYRVYSKDLLDRLFRKFSRTQYSFFCNSHGSWIPSSVVTASQVNSASKVQAMVLAVCHK